MRTQREDAIHLGGASILDFQPPGVRNERLCFKNHPDRSVLMQWPWTDRAGGGGRAGWGGHSKGRQVSLETAGPLAALHTEEEPVNTPRLPE